MLTAGVGASFAFTSLRRSRLRRAARIEGAHAHVTVTAVQHDLPALARVMSGSRSPARAEDARIEPDLSGAENFSFALAAASVRSQAARALEAHGATPAETTTPSRHRQDRAGSRVANEAKANRGVGETATPDRNASAHFPRPTAVPTSSIASPNAAPSGLSGAAAPAADGLTAPVTAPVAISPATTTRNVVDASAARDGALQRPSNAANRSGAPSADRAAASEPESAADKQVDFARLLARRATDSASDFELRLDPPHLGRITGKLSIGEDGRTIMSLSFDNQETFDLFSRDVDLLRSTLTDAGLSVGSGDLSFSLTNRQARDPATASPKDTMGSENVVTRTLLTPDAQFFARWSSGLVDIKI